MSTNDPIREPEKTDGEYAPAGEGEGNENTFSPDDVAAAFEVDIQRVHNAISGEFGDAAGAIDSRRAQHLAEVLLGDQPLEQREAAVMKLGAFVPRSDHAYGSGEKPEGEESDRLAGDSTERGGKRGST